MRVIRLSSTTFLFAAAAAFSFAVPASAQMYSDGYKFMEAVKNKEGTEAQELLDKPGSTVVNARDISNGRTALHLVVERRDLTWIKWLAQEGANPNIADNNGVTPLILATQLGFIEGVDALIKAGAQVDVANKSGETPLIFGVHSRNRDLMEALLKAGADPDRRDNSGRSARDYAVERGADPRMVEAIAEHAKPASEREGAKVYGPSF